MSNEHHILCIEDEVDIQEIIAYNLQKAGYSVSVAEDGLKGLELAKAKLPDLILLDVMMPKLNGFEVLKALGMRRAMVVHGSGLDEVAIHGDTLVCELNNNEITQYTLTPEILGVERAQLTALVGGHLKTMPYSRALSYKEKVNQLIITRWPLMQAAPCT